MADGGRRTVSSKQRFETAMHDSTERACIASTGFFTVGRPPSADH
jgi:hypothetical protein